MGSDKSVTKMTPLTVALFVLASLVAGSHADICYATDDPFHPSTDWEVCIYGCCQDFWVVSTDDMCCDDPSIWVDPGYVGGFSAGVIFFIIFFILGCCRYRARRRVIVSRTVVAQEEILALHLLHCPRGLLKLPC